MNREALIVGINKYAFLKDGKGKPRHLKSAAADAVAIAKMLRDHGRFKVRLALAADKADGSPPVDRGLISDIKLKREGLEEAIARLFNPPSDLPNEVPNTAILFFAGHGFVKEVGGVKEGFLVTSDANGKDRLGVSLSWLRSVLALSPVRQKLVWLDCCHSGHLLNFDEAFPDDLGRDKNTCLIAASRSFELAEEAKEHGVFTAALLEALDPNNYEDPWVTNYSLTDRINKRLQASNQLPVIRNFGNEIVITGEPEQVHKADLQAGVCPYKGLEPFGEGDAKYFYGRTTLVDEMLNQLRQSNFLAVVGASGSGKSSAVKAGLLHQLKLGQRLSGSDEWKIVVFRPGEHPLESLVRAFNRAPEQFDFRDGLNLAQLVQSTGAKSVVLAADQFEEAFTLCQDIELRKQFMSCLLGSLDDPHTNLRVIITMRVDFLGKCLELEYSGLTKKIQNHQVLVGPMNGEELREAIEKPAWKVGLDVQRELVEHMLSDVEGPGILPLLQYTLWELWQNRKVNRLTLAEYTKQGGVTGALQIRANEVYQSLDDKQQSAARWIFMNLTQVNEGAEDTRKQALKSALSNEKHSKEVIDATIDKLVEARLLVTDKQPGREETVDVAHEALIRHWDRLRGWVNENREAIRFNRKIQSEAEEWSSKGKSDAYLLRGPHLVQAQSYQKKYSDLGLLSELGKDFLEKSIRRKRGDRLEGLVSAVLLLLSLIGVRAMGFFDVIEWGIRDQFFNMRPAEPVDSRIAIVTIDESDITKLGQWPMSDRVMAQLLQKLIDQQPRSIGLSLYRDLPIEPGNQELEAIFEETPNLIGVEKLGGNAIAPPPTLSKLGQVGAADLILDGDGKVRRALLGVITPEGELRQGLGALLALMYLKSEGVTPESIDAEKRIFGLGKAVFAPLMGNSGGYGPGEVGGYQILLNYRGPLARFETVSMTEVLEDNIEPGIMRDRIVLIGVSAPSLNELFYTPYSNNLFSYEVERTPGVVIHANVTSMILSGAIEGRTMLRSTNHELESLWIGLWFFIGATLTSRLPGRSLWLNWRWGIGMLAAVGVLLGSTYGAFLAGWSIPVVVPLIALAGATIAVGVVKSS